MRSNALTRDDECIMFVKYIKRRTYYLGLFTIEELICNERKKDRQIIITIVRNNRHYLLHFQIFFA